MWEILYLMEGLLVSVTFIIFDVNFMEHIPNDETCPPIPVTGAAYPSLNISSLKNRS